MVLANFFIQEFELRIVSVIPFRMSLQSPLRFRGFLSLSKSSSPAWICCHVAAPHELLLKCPRKGWSSPRRTSWAHESSSSPCLSKCWFQRQAWRDPDESYHATVLFTCTESQLILVYLDCIQVRLGTTRLLTECLIQCFIHDSKRL